MEIGRYNIANQDGEIVGSYRNMNDKIQKLDANGNVVKEKVK